MANAASFHWGEIALSQVVDIDGTPHVSRQSVGEWLEYQDEPADRIRRLIGRNPHIEDYSVPVNLTATDGKNYDTRVYHPIGFLLIVMESGQPKAQEMKVAVAEFVWAFCGSRDLPVKERNSYLNEIERLTESLVNTKNAMLFKQRHAQLQYYCSMARWPMPDLTMRTAGVEQLPLLGDNHG